MAHKEKWFSSPVRVGTAPNLSRSCKPCAMSMDRNEAEDVPASSSLEDIWRVIDGSDAETEVNSQRHYRNIRIFGANLSEYNEEFWEKIGRYLRRLELIDCNSTPEVFNLITRHCPQLKSLEVKAIRRFHERETFSEEIFSTLEGDKSDEVQHLATDSNMTEEIIEHLLASMPRAASFSLRSHGSLNCLPCILKTRHTFTKLEIFSVGISDSDVVALLDMYSESLQMLRLFCERLTQAAFSAIGDCSRLQHLTLFLAIEFEDSHLEKVVRNSPELETLEIYHCRRLTDVGLAHIYNLKGLQNLGIRGIRNLTINAFRRAGGIPTLRRLNFDDPCGSRIDITVIRNIGSLKNLRALRLKVVVDSEGLDIICSNLGMLEELHLEHCHNKLTDADGVKLCRLARLKSLRLGGCSRLTDLFFEEGIGSPAMECLDLSLLPSVGLASLAAHHGHLRELRFFFCGITDAGLAILLQREPFLEKLTLEFCGLLSDRILRELENRCPRLRYLELVCCRVSTETLELFKRQRPLVRAEKSGQVHNSTGSFLNRKSLPRC